MNKAGVEAGGPASLLAHLWQLNQRPDVYEILRQAGELTTKQVISVLCVDQFQRWQRGERVAVEDIIRSLPYLHDADELADLIVNEYMLREEQGDSPTSGEYCNRFPHLVSALQKRLQVHRQDRGAKLSLLGEMTSAGVAQIGAVPAPAPTPTPVTPAPAAAPVAEKRKPWPELKNYEILTEVGRGGMGRVYKARHVRLDRIVALKLVNFHRLSDDERIIRRFEREARAAAQLNHPNIVLIYDFDFDEQHEIYYISMEYVEGRDLLRIVQENGPLSVQSACEYMRQAALGLQHAFESGMVHRDIKPPNLLVTQSAPAGIVKILDMGLVLIPEEGGSHLTQQGMVVGTPDYMAPEQTVDSHQVDIRADLYSLGCTLYHVLTGAAPYADCKMLQKLFMHQTSEPRPIREVRPDVPPALEKILATLLAKRPEDRYQTPLEFGRAIGELLTSPKKMAAPAQPLSLADLILGDLEEQMNEGRMAATPLPDAVRAIPKPVPDEPAIPSPERFVVFRGHQGWVTTVGFAPNRRFLASGGVDGSLRVWDLGSKAKDRLRPRAHDGDVTALAVDPQNRTVATGAGALDGHVRLWDIGSERIEPNGDIRVGMAGIDALAFSPDGNLLATGDSERVVKLWELVGSEPKHLASLKGHADPVKVVAFDPFGKMLASADQKGAVRVWNPAAFWSKDLAVLEGRWGQVFALCFSRDGKYLAFGSLDQKIYLWEMNEGRPRCRAILEAQPGVVHVLQFNTDSSDLLSITDHGRLILWDVETGNRKREWQLTKSSGNMAVTRDGRYLAVGAGDGSIALYRLYPKHKDRDKDKE